MLIKRTDGSEPAPSEITPRDVYLDRRRFLAGMGLTASALALGYGLRDHLAAPAPVHAAPLKTAKSPYSVSDKVTPLESVSQYNNFYEFGTGKSDPAKNAHTLITSPWSVEVGGLVKKPRNFTIDEIKALAPLEERICRHRCVEAWSIVVPWIGYSLSHLLQAVEPTSKARFVAFQSFYDPKQMPLARSAGIDFPYREGLRLDEAMHPLALLCVGMYGEDLLKQDGAPVRLVVPWKYGYKSAKSLVKITLVEKMPPTTWNRYAPDEYGFYSNVNPNVDRTPWSQSSERRLGDWFKRPTQLFNGYAQVASLYKGMDLRRDY